MHLQKIIVLLVIMSGSFNAFSQDKDLYRTIQQLDSSFFHAYNTCDLKTQEQFYADSIEFFHDRSGLDTSKRRILENTKKYICGKVTRSLVPGTLEVSPLPGYGAVAVGMHRFHNNQEKDAPSNASRFVILWRHKEGKWQITKVISLH
jgi:ketosteroid isomerase-like protein